LTKTGDTGANDAEFLEMAKADPYFRYADYLSLMKDRKEEAERDARFTKRKKILDGLVKKLVGKKVEKIEVITYGNTAEYDAYEPPRLKILFNDGTQIDFPWS